MKYIQADDLQQNHSNRMHIKGAVITKLLQQVGGSAEQDLCMQLIGRFCGHDVAIQTSHCALVNLSTHELGYENVSFFSKQAQHF